MKNNSDGSEFRYKKAVYSLVIFIAGLFGGLWYSSLNTSKTSIINPFKPSESSETREGGGKYTNPLLECSQAEFSELMPFKDKIAAKISELEAKEGIKDVAVYFRDLNNGPWFGIDERTPFSPASLLKVPLAIAYFKLAESEPEILKNQIIFEGSAESSSVQQEISPKEALQINQAYEVEDLIFRMLAYSDNNSYELLIKNIDFEDLTRIYKDFGLSLKEIEKTEEFVNLKNYSGFFRILFNASYLSQADSEKILNMLVQSDFKEGLVSGVPATMEVSHKFGERGSLGSDDFQFHDCGIVYFPKRPYLLCVMTKGSNIENQIDAISSVSSKVYSEIASQN